MVALLAILKSGAAYLPLDPEYPEDRLRFMLEDSAPAALLTQSHLKKLFAGIRDNLPVLREWDENRGPFPCLVLSLRKEREGQQHCAQQCDRPKEVPTHTSQSGSLTN